MQLIFRHNGFSDNFYGFERRFNSKHINIVNLKTVNAEQISIVKNVNTFRTNRSIRELSYFQTKSRSKSHV